MANSMGEERRKALRVHASLFVQYCLDDKSEPKKWDISTVKDISESGVCLQTGKAFEKGSPIVLRFKIPSRPFEMTEIKAESINCEIIGQSSTYLIRARFVDLNEETLKTLREFVLTTVKNRGPR